MQHGSVHAHAMHRGQVACQQQLSEAMCLAGPLYWQPLLAEPHCLKNEACGAACGMLNAQPKPPVQRGLPAIVPHLLMREDMPTIAPWPASIILGSSPFTRV